MGSRRAKAKLTFLNSLKRAPFLLHKKVYKKGPKWYKRWSDKDYSSVIHSSIIVWVAIVFFSVSMAWFLAVSINQTGTQEAKAGSYSVTWTTLGDFDYNDVTTNTATVKGGGIDLYAAEGYLTVEPGMQGTLSKLLIDAGEGQSGNWSSILGATDIVWPETEVRFRTRGSNDNITWPDVWDGPSGIGSNDYFSLNGGTLTTAPSRYLEIEVTLISAGDFNTFLDSFTVLYNTIEPPTSLVQYSNLQLQTELIAGSWWANNLFLSSQITCLEDSPCRAEYEFKNSEVSFNGSDTILGNELSAGATGSSTAEFNGVLFLGTYLWRVRVLDNAGRSTGWVNYNNGQAAIQVEKTAPTGNIVIENGESYTQGPSVHFSVTAADDGGSSLHSLPIRFSNDNQTWSAWEAIAEYKVWDLIEGVGTRTVYMQIRDNCGNVTTVSDSISTDNTLPTATFDPNNRFPAANWNVKENVNSVEFHFNTDKPTVAYVDYGIGDVKTEANGKPVVSTSHNILVKNLKSSTTYRYRLRFIDEFNNMGTSPLNADEEGGDFYTFTTGKTDIGFEGDPLASNLSQVEITASTAKITWKTKVPTTSWVDYGLTTSYGNTAGDDSLLTAHIVELKNLVAGETYHYRVRGTDSGDNEFVSNEFSFKAIMNPQISNVKVEEVTPYTAKISWTTNVKTDSDVAYGESTTYSNRDKDTGFLTVHSVMLKNLTDNVTYHFQVEARDEYGNATKSQDFTFTTPLDTVGPKISDVKIDMLPMASDEETATVIISWKTDKPATGKIEYGEGLVGGKYEKSTIEDTSLNYLHTAIIRELNPATTYHYRLVSKDKNTNKTESVDYNVVTQEKQKSIWQLIVRSLEDTFNWLRDVPKFWEGLGEKIR